jgi:hypothetical protein
MRIRASVTAILTIILSLGASTAWGFMVNIGSQMTSSSSSSSGDPALLYNFKTSKAWVFWDQDPASNLTIFYRIYDPSCLQSACLLPPATRLTTDSHANFLPSASQSLNGSIWVFWVSTRTGNNAVFYKVYNGTAWTSDIQFTTYIGNNIRPSVISTQDGGLLVAWASGLGCASSNSTCITNIFLRKYDGTVWLPAQQATFSGRDYEPSLAQTTNGTIWLTWASDRAALNGKDDIFYKTINPLMMGPDIQLTNSPHNDDFPSIVAVKNSNSKAVAVVWSSDRNSTYDSFTNATVPEYDIFLKYSLDGGISWSAKDTKLNHDPILTPSVPVDDIAPSAALLGSGRIGIVWQSDMTGTNYNIFSMSLFIADGAVTAVTPGQTVLAQGNILKVNATLSNLGWEAETFPVTLSANGTFIQSLQASLAYQGTSIVTFAWNTTGFALGNYVLNVTAANLTGEANPSNNIMTTKIILTIPGDVNGDRKVNIVDLTIVALAFGSVPGSPTWNPNADVTMDGKVDIRDLTFVAIHFGQSG